MELLAVGSIALAALDRQQQRREAGLPTISVLCGTGGRAEQAGRRWAEGRGRAVVAIVVDDPRPEVLIDAWIDALAAGRDLERDAMAWLARRQGRDAAEFGAWLGRKTSFERELFLDSVLPCESEDAVEAECRRLLTPTAGLARPADREGLVAALHGLVPPGSAPALLALRPAAEGSAWIESVATSLARLAGAEPRLPLLLAIEPETLDAYHRHAPESRARSLIRAGTIFVPDPPPHPIDQRLGEALPGLSATLAGPIRRLTADGASERLLGLFVEAARAGAEPQPDDQARSAAEWFLAERLATLPRTAGLFELNGRLAFAFGTGRAIEVDLVARSLRLAIEIDGYYHFRDADAYRRDRRKDFVLQEHGFFVVRVLADDVVRRLEETLDQILAAVAIRSRGNIP